MIPPGFIGVPCGENHRTSDFSPNVVRLCASAPPGTDFQKVAGLGPAGPLNELGRTFLANSKYRWLLLLNDDNLHPPDTIHKLWEAIVTLNFDVVGGLYLSRTMPFEPLAFDAITEPDRQLPEKPLSNRWYRRYYTKPGDCGVIPIVACGDGCLMITREVMEKIGDPWWEYGETIPGACDHDMVFCRKVREAGFRIGLHTGVIVDHVAQFTVRPVTNEKGEWAVELVQANDKRITLPAASAGWKVG